MNRSKGVELRFGYDLLAPSGYGDANQVGIDNYVLFGSNTTYVWTGSPQVIMLLTARFEYDHKPDSPPSDTFTFGGEKDRGPALLFIITYTWI